MKYFCASLVSNATDATQKLKTLSSIGDFKGDTGDINIEIKLDAKAKTITISDKGIGMTAEEVEKYINQIAFSSAEEWIDKVKASGEKNGIIGHFGLGFYSSFMVAKKVEIHTLSWQEGAKAVKWECEGNPEFEISDDRKNRQRYRHYFACGR
jgi:molecular chaperone HtpG